MRKGSAPLSEIEPVAMFHSGRCGSTVVGDMLDQHPMIFWDGEIYETAFLNWESRTGEDGLQHIPIDPAHWLHDRMGRACKNVYGFEVKYFHLRVMGVSLGKYLERLDQTGIERIIILSRKNYLRQALSGVIAHANRSFHRLKKERISLSKIRLNPDHVELARDAKPLLEYFKEYEEDREALETLAADRKILKLIYEEDISSDPIVGYGRICEFLGVTAYKPTVGFGKTNPFHISDMVVNFRELEMLLKGTPYEWMLYS